MKAKQIQRFVNCSLPCGCKIVNDGNHTGIDMCAQHRAADALYEALLTAKDALRFWNGIGMGKLDSEQEKVCWKLYQASTEMKKINAALEASHAS